LDVVFNQEFVYDKNVEQYSGYNAAYESIKMYEQHPLKYYVIYCASNINLGCGPLGQSAGYPLNSPAFYNFLFNAGAGSKLDQWQSTVESITDHDFSSSYVSYILCGICGQGKHTGQEEFAYVKGGTLNPMALMTFFVPDTNR